MSYGNYPDLKGVKKILVVKMRHHGDVLLTSPVFSNLQKVLPKAKIDAFIYRDTFPMLEGHSAISDFLLYDREWKNLPFFSKILKESSLFKEIRKRGYNLVLNLTEGDRGALASLVSGAKIRVGFDPEGKGFIGKKKIYTHVVKNCKTPRHTVERQLDALRCIGIFPEPKDRDLTFHIPVETLEKMQQKEDYILIHPVSRWRFKCWPVSHMIELIQQLHVLGHRIALTSSPDKHEMAMAKEILHHCSDIPILNFAGNITLKELGALIRKAKLLISVDSVPLHIASATKTPVVVLFGPSSEQNWGPWMHPDSRVVAQQKPCRPCYMDGCGGSKMSDCLHTLPVKTVLQAANELLSRKIEVEGMNILSSSMSDCF
jgi:heptosyltransferase-3